MKIKTKTLADWQRRCNDIQRASEALDHNKDSIYRQEYVRAYRYAVRRCVQAERKM